MSPFPEEAFVRGVEALVRANLRFVPPRGKGTFYVRPMQHATEPQLGLRSSRRFWVLMFGSPVGDFFSPRTGAAGPPAGLRLKVLEQARCPAGGTGSAKAMGNYAGSLALAEPWKGRGFDDVLFLDAREQRHLGETCGSNVFVRLRDGRLVTPQADDQILAGVTRDSVMRLARELLGVTVEERSISIDETLADGAEVFCTGTAWTVRSVLELEHRGRLRRFESDELQRQLLALLIAIQEGERDDPFGWVHPLPDAG
jgi:branched-chain amino acid aminotransferase